MSLRRASSEESVLSSLTEVFQRLSELAIQGANGTMASEDRLVLAAEVSELRKEVFRLGNTKDLDGNYLFSGNKIKCSCVHRGCERQCCLQWRFRSFVSERLG